MNDTELGIRFDLGGNATAEEEEQFGIRLHEELLDAGALRVESMPVVAAPAGAKGVSAETGALLVTLAGAGSILGPIVNAIVGTFRSHTGSITLKLNGNEITVSDPSSSDQGDLIRAWIAAQETRKI